jgi:hypothetical protein
MQINPALTGTKTLKLHDMPRRRLGKRADEIWQINIQATC